MLNPKFSFAYTYDISVSHRVNLLKDRRRWHVGAGDERLGPDLVQEPVRGLHRHQVPGFQLVPVRKRREGRGQCYRARKLYKYIPKLSKMFW